MTPDQTLALIRAVLTLAAPALVLAADLKWTLSRRQMRLAAIAQRRPVRRPDPQD